MKCEPVHPDTLRAFHENLQSVLKSVPPQPSEELQSLLGSLGNDSDNNFESNDDNDEQSDEDHDPFNVINSTGSTVTTQSQRVKREGDANSKYTFRNIKAIPKVSSTLFVFSYHSYHFVTI